jgi:hypothetical protein
VPDIEAPRWCLEPPRPGTLGLARPGEPLRPVVVGNGRKGTVGLPCQDPYTAPDEGPCAKEAGKGHRVYDRRTIAGPALLSHPAGHDGRHRSAYCRTPHDYRGGVRIGLIAHVHRGGNRISGTRQSVQSVCLAQPCRGWTDGHVPRDLQGRGQRRARAIPRVHRQHDGVPQHDARLRQLLHRRRLHVYDHPRAGQPHVLLPVP